MEWNRMRCNEMGLGGSRLKRTGIADATRLYSCDCDAAMQCDVPRHEPTSPSHDMCGMLRYATQRNEKLHSAADRNEWSAMRGED